MAGDTGHRLPRSILILRQTGNLPERSADAVKSGEDIFVSRNLHFQIRAQLNKQSQYPVKPVCPAYRFHG